MEQSLFAVVAISALAVLGVFYIARWVCELFFSREVEHTITLVLADDETSTKRRLLALDYLRMRGARVVYIQKAKPGQYSRFVENRLCNGIAQAGELERVVRCVADLCDDGEEYYEDD